MKNKYCVIRKVPYRVPATNRILWANVLSERYGLALILVPASDERQPHSIVIAVENADRVFERVEVNGFDLKSEEMMEVGQKLRFLGKLIYGAELDRLLNFDDLL